MSINTSNLQIIEDLNKETSQTNILLGLERVNNLLNEIGNPCIGIPAIQILGTNGKGSITSFIKSALIVSGLKVGVATSPHLISWCERISINNVNISTEDFNCNYFKLSELFEKYNLTIFERIIALSFNYFAINCVDLMVLEVGLGGRLDATTAHKNRPIIAMGSIGIDHCEYLGNNLDEIAIEKLAAIPVGSCVVSAGQDPLVMKLLEDQIKNKKAKLNLVKPLSGDWELGLSGQIQKINAAVAKGALEALKDLGWDLKEKEIRKGFAMAYWPARMQLVKWKDQSLFIDGAHNPQAAEQLSQERLKWVNNENGVIWILGIQCNKDGPEILRKLLQKNDQAWIVPVNNLNSWTLESLGANCPELLDQLFQDDCVEEVLTKLICKKTWPSPPPVVAGSLYLIGDLLSKKIINV